jgi:hypothetical protein
VAARAYLFGNYYHILYEYASQVLSLLKVVLHPAEVVPVGDAGDKDFAEKEHIGPHIKVGLLIYCI